jgi:hypothetical protein
MLFTFFNNTQQQHSDMPQNVDFVGQHYIAINIVNVCSNEQTKYKSLNWQVYQHCFTLAGFVLQNADIHTVSIVSLETILQTLQLFSISEKVNLPNCTREINCISYMIHNIQFI